jgi:hypothetical protein
MNSTTDTLGGVEITDAMLASIRVLFRAPDTLALYGIRYEMRAGQAPRDLWLAGRRAEAGTAPRSAAYSDPRNEWIWLGSPGWWGTMPRESRARVEAWLAKHALAIPQNPYEWCRIAPSSEIQNAKIPPALTRISARFGTRLIDSAELSPPWQFVTKHPLALDVAIALCTALHAAGFQAAHETADPERGGEQLVFASGPQRFKFTIEFDVAEVWIADGFDLTDSRAQDLLRNALPWCYDSEVGARVIARPADEDMARAQGYASVEEWRRMNKRNP